MRARGEVGEPWGLQGDIPGFPEASHVETQVNDQVLALTGELPGVSRP